MSLFGTILGAVAGPIAGLFGSKKSKPQVVENRVDYARMVRDAEAAGFNPLTALRNGGSAGFSSQISHPALSSGGFGSGLADALATGISAWANYDPMAEQRSDLEYQLVQAQLDSVQKMNRQERRSFDVPVHTGTSGRISPGGFVASTPAPSSAGSSYATAPGKATNPWTGPLLGGFMTIDPGIQDADTFETRYADIGSNVAGLGIMGADAVAAVDRRRPGFKDQFYTDPLGALDRIADSNQRWLNENSGKVIAKTARKVREAVVGKPQFGPYLPPFNAAIGVSRAMPPALQFQGMRPRAW